MSSLSSIGNSLCLSSFKAISVLVLVFGLQGCSSGNENESATAVEVDSASLSVVIKSPNDSREYRHIKLKNQLDVLLISDPEAEKSAAALDVYVGSYQNPKSREGLVHFLEHMLFLGTKDYPNPGDYQTFISEHGGSHNAGTGLENTTYFFDINSAYLEQALDRFAPFFSSPNFDAKYVDRERNAVESEYRLKIKDDGRRGFDVLQQQVDPKHPLSKFTVGNLQTLADNETSTVRDELIASYQRYYSANLMKLVVLGNESLDELEAMIVPRFEIIANTDAQVEAPIDYFVAKERLPLAITVKPLKDTRSLDMSFQLPNLQSMWRTKPARFLGSLMGYEGEGSLAKLLKDRGWIESLSAGQGLQDRSASLFSIDMALTPEGYRQRHQITEMTFAWIQYLQCEGLQGWRYDEQAQIADISFRFKQKQGPMGYVSGISGLMQLYPVADVLHAGYVMEGYDEKQIADILNKLTPDNLIMTVTAPEVKTDSVTERYQADYSAGPVDAQVVAKWESPAKVAELGSPDKNRYLPSDLPVVANSDPQQVPGELIDSEGLRAWHLVDTRYAVPKAHVIASLGTDKTSSLEGMVKAELYLDIIRDQLNATVYPATEAGLSFSLSVDGSGLSVVVGGYSDKQAVLLADILAVLKEPDWDVAKFEQLKQTRLRKFDNFQREYPFRQGMAGVYAMVSGRWTPLQKAPVLKAVTMEQLQAYSEDLLSAVELQVLVSGNHTEVGARALVKQLSSALPLAEITNPSVIAKLPAGENQVQIPVDHDDAVQILYIQAASDSLAQRATFAVMAEMLSAPFYNSLRTEKQLGYVVSAFASHFGPVPGLAMLAQSPVADEEQLRQEFLQFLKDYRADVSELAAEDLERYQASLLGSLEEKPKNLSEMNSRFMTSLGLGYDGFDFREQLAAAIRGVTVESLQLAYGDMILSNPRALWLKTAGPGEPNTVIDLRDGGEIYSYDF